MSAIAVEFTGKPEAIKHAWVALPDIPYQDFFSGKRVNQIGHMRCALTSMQPPKHVRLC